ncbi:TRAP transporter large permease subunit [Salipiger sp. P9]|uniref:TRAP transporter large permease n=1 Tax=Salipiger pentaromativorans TaxID=2943193 RepID=UPI0021570E25|nr:TRAP transporter large permease subunit [Salipiger pentaromativorans]MCR8549254.1 TRAP transporter large permease subunit [Salipiger pentaromativorans]
MVLTSGLVVLFVMLALGIPVAISLAVSGAVGLYLIGGSHVVIGIIGSTAESAMHSYEFAMIPLFILMANFILVSGVGDDMFDIAKKWMGRTPGGLAHATAATGAAFGAISGSSTAAAATLASTSIPGMIRQGYDVKLASGVAAISGTLAMLIPPSAAMVIYALLAEMSIAKLLIAGLVPGLLITLTIILTVLLLVWLRPDHAPAAQSYSLREKIRSLRTAWSFMLLFSLVTLTIYLGIGTPTEASALGALGAFVLAVIRRPNLRVFAEATVRAVSASCMIAFIVFGALIFGYFLTLTQVAQNLITFLAESQVDRTVILICILGMYLVLGCFVDLITMLILTVPIVSPLIVHLGYDPIWFAVLTIIMGEVGMVTPPMGLNCFVISKYTNIPVGQVFRGSYPHVLAHLVLVAILAAFPQIILWLPGTMN